MKESISFITLKLPSFTLYKKLVFTFHSTYDYFFNGAVGPDGAKHLTQDAGAENREPQTVVLTLSIHQNHPEGLPSTDVWVPSLDNLFSNSGKGARICFSYKFAGNAATSGPWK